MVGWSVKKKFLIGGLIVFLAIGYLAFTGFRGSATYYYTVSEFVTQGNSIDGRNVRINGQVVAGSVEQEVKSQTLRFTITEGAQNLPVVYHGVVPDAFKTGIEVVVEGHLDLGIFQANSILTKCPSKYVPQ